MTVEVYGDLLCPWCYIGKRRLDAALRGLGPASTAGTEVIWRSYELGAQNRTPAATASEEFSLMWGDEAPRRLARIDRLGEVEGSSSTWTERGRS